jgi:hypothetical protein
MQAGDQVQVTVGRHSTILAQEGSASQMVRRSSRIVADLTYPDQSTRSPACAIIIPMSAGTPLTVRRHVDFLRVSSAACMPA